MANEVKFKLAVEGKGVVKQEVDGITQSLDKATAATDRIGMSTKAYNAALRGVPAQFTDIFTSLAGGQAPMTVLLQQGGQLKDMFGGAGNAAKALGGYVLGLANPITVGAAAVGTMALAYHQATSEVDNNRKAIVLSGNAAGVTNDQMQSMARTVSDSARVTVSASAAVLAQFVGGGDVAAASLAKATQEAIRFERLGGVAIKETLTAYAELANDPVAASEKLNRQYNYLTASVYEQIKALSEQGDKSAAVSLAQNELTSAQARMADEIELGLGRIEQAWNKAGRAAVSAWDNFKGLFRPEPIEDRIAALEKVASYKNGFYGTAPDSGSQAKAQEELNYWKHILASQQDYASYQAKIKTQTDAQIALDKAYESGLGKTAKMQREIAAAAGNFANVDQTDPANISKYAKTIADIQEKYKETKPKITEAAKGLALYNDLMDTGSGYAATYAEDQQKLAAALKSGVIKSYTDYAAAVQILVDKQPFMVKAHEAEKKAIDELAKARENELKAHATELASLTEKAQKLEDEAAYYGMSKTAIEELTTARMLDQIEVLKGFDNSGEEIARIEQVIAARKRLAAAGTALDMKETMDKADKAMVEANRRAAEESSKYWEDALMRAFERGEGFFEAMWSTIKNTLKSQVLRVTIQGVMSTVGLGASGAAVASSGGSSALGSVGNLSTLWDQITTGNLSSTSALVSNGAVSVGKAFFNLGLNNAGQAMNEVGNAAIKYADQLNFAGNALSYLNAANQFANGQYGSAIGTAIGTYVGGPIGGAIGNALGSLVDGLFGGGATEVTGSGTRGTFAASGKFTGSNYVNYHQDGGWFSGDSNWTETSAIDQATVTAWQNAFVGVKQSVGAMAISLGQSTDKVASYTKTIDVAAGTTAEQMQALFVSMADEMAAAVAPGLSAIAKSGESASVTMSRLSTSLTSVNAWMQRLQKSTMAVSLAGGDKASALVDLFGSVDTFASSTQAYYDAFYSAGERNTQTMVEVAKALSLVNVALPTSKDAFRSVVSSLDLTTEAGRNAYSVMMSVAPAFASVADAVTSMTDSVLGEAKRIRKLMAGDSTNSYAAAQASFAINTAQARAGDQTALAALPSLSQALLKLAETNAVSAVDLARVRAQTASSLETTASTVAGSYGLKLPSFDVGTNYVPRDMIAQIHKGEAITPAAYNPAAGGRSGGGDAQLLSALQALSDQFDDVHTAIRAVATHSEKTAKLLRRVTRDGEAMQTVTA